MDSLSVFIEYFVYGGVLYVGVVGGLYLCGVTVSDLADWFFAKFGPKRPKERMFRVLVEDDEGWPYRSYKLPFKQVAGLVRDIERNRPE